MTPISTGIEAAKREAVREARQQMRDLLCALLRDHLRPSIEQLAAERRRLELRQQLKRKGRAGWKRRN